MSKLFGTAIFCRNHNFSCAKGQLLIMYNRHLNKKDLAPKEVIEGLIAARKSYDQKQQLRGDVIEENTRQLEKPDEGQ